MVRDLADRLFHMQNAGIKTDATFMVQDVEFQCHSLVIFAHGGPLADLIVEKKRITNIQDISPHTFRMIIQFLYTGECTVSPGNAFELLHAAKKFGIPALEDQCVTVGATKLTEDNILAYTQEAIDFDSKEFLSSCTGYAKQNAKTIIQQPAFKDVSIEVLETICSLEGTNCSVLELFAACVGWAEEERKRQKLEESSESIRTVLGNILDKIKFEDMDMDDFIEFVVPEGILTDEKVGQLINRWQKDKKKKHWKETLQVGIWDPSSDYCTFAFLPLHTRIRDVKERKIFSNGKLQGPCDQFTIAYRIARRSLEPVSDSTALASIIEEGEDSIRLRVNEMTCRVKDSKDWWEIPVTFTSGDLHNKRTDVVIRGRMAGYYETRDYDVGYDVGSAKIQTPSPIIPGSTFIVTAQPKRR